MYWSPISSVIFLWPPPLPQWQWTGNGLSLIRPFTLLVTTDSPSVPPENQMVPQTFLHPPFPLPHPRSDTNSYVLHSWWGFWSMVYQFFRPPDCCFTIRTILCWTFLRIFAFIFISLRAGRNAISDHIRQKLSKDKQAVKCPTLTRSKKSKRRSMNATEDFITNKSAVFMQPHRRRPSHFEIHPEFHYVPAKWKPIYQSFWQWANLMKYSPISFERTTLHYTQVASINDSIYALN